MEQKQLSIVEEYSVPAVGKAKGKNYELYTRNGSITLLRDVDFGKIPNTSKPTLLKAGAEKILGAYGVGQEYTIEKAIEEWNTETPFFYYRVKCTLFTYINGQRFNLTDGFGSANTMERQCGRASAMDTANSRLKIARKRAMVDATLMLAQISSLFYQDLEDDSLESAKIDVVREDEPISAKQIKRLFTVASRAGVTDKAAGEIIKSFGYESSKDIKNKDYDSICEAVGKGISV